VELEAALRRYAAQNLRQEVRIANLKSDLNYSIRSVDRNVPEFRLKFKSRLTKFKELQRKFNIPRVRKPPALEVSRQAVIDKVQMDVSQNNGPNYFKTLLQQEGLMVPRFVRVPFELTLERDLMCIGRDTIRKIMLEHFPLGFDTRFPGKKKFGIPRTPLNSNGPFHEISSDGHEKLGKQALDMGDIGLPIYGYKDKWSDSIPFIQFVPDSRTAAAIGHLFLDFIETAGGKL
jgi:hypothetical protein